ncbi:mechanosensitive ion channel protein 4/5/6/7/8/9/10 [Nematocida sp. LUAm3]|nr:mechanosensitive ion channel protein 4/5/6/7/8/9/10 [Nematocida sp. LUAm3]KAI5173764.1 mechanosensitive ion channel protein 4/5/6/7/8/9/10 [Nematocida sp. LUAm2]KAI5176987.1 mechanosensitive ion channel protein 4/5/6/7/8/9/10 [Nematocida sp. LUAm1]
MSEDESHETFGSSSVESNGEEKREETQEEVDIQKTKLYHTLSPWRKFWYSLKEFSLIYIAGIFVAIVLIVTQTIIQALKKDVEYTIYQNERPMQISSSFVIGMVGYVFLGFILLDCLVYYLSSFLLDKIDLLTLPMSYANGVSTLLSALVFSFVLVGLLWAYDLKYKIKPNHDLSLDQLLVTIFFVLLLNITKEMFVKRVRMGFNHTNYLARIQRCLMENQFIKTLEIVKRRIKGHKKGNRHRYWMFSQPAQQERQSDEESPTGTPHPDGIEDGEKYFKPKSLALSDTTMSLKQKMIIFREFEKILGTKVYRSDKGPVLGTDFKQEAQRKAEKIAHWLSTEKKRFQVKHLKRYVDSEYVDTIMRLLGLQENVPLSEKEIATLIERNKREKYSVKRSLVQMDKALLRVSRFVTATIILSAVAILLSTTIAANNDIVKGVLGTFFGLGFIFQTSVKNAIDSVIFLFIVHPYDIGDRIKLEIDKEEHNMVVSELNVFSTVFYQWDGAKIYIPNHVLLQKPITNVRRSGLMAENIIFQISFDTPSEKIQHLKSEITKFIKKHPKDFAPYFMFNYHGIEDTNKLHIKIYLQHATNWQNYEAYLQRKAKFIMFLKEAIAEQEIEYSLPVQRVEILSKKNGSQSPLQTQPVQFSEQPQPAT